MHRVCFTVLLIYIIYSYVLLTCTYAPFCRLGPGVVIKVQSKNVTENERIPKLLPDDAPERLTELETYVNLKVVTRLLQ